MNREAAQHEDRGLSRLRSSTTLTLSLVLGAYLCVAVIARHQLAAAITVALAAGGALLVITAWERGASNIAAVAALALGAAAGTGAWVADWNAMAATPLGFTVGALSSRWGAAVSSQATSVAMSGVALAAAAFVVGGVAGTGWSLIPAVVAAVAVLLVGLLFVFNHYVWGLIVEVDRSRQMAEEITRLRERERLANDLHDIQGQNMTAVRMKLSVIDRLMERDPDRARQEIDEVKGLIDQASEDTRALIVGNRVLTVPAELANSKGLLEATGAEVDVNQVEDIPDDNAHIMARVLREATTNILKHSAAQTVNINVGTDHVKVVNDGARGPAGQVGGLGSLEMALGNAGWAVHYETEGESFVLTCHKRHQAMRQN